MTVVNPKSTEIIGVEAELKDGRMVGKITKSESGLNALDFRKSVKDAGGKKELFDKVKNSSPDIDFLDFNYANLDSLNQPVRIEYKIATKEKQEGNAGIIYIDPMSVERQRNPFASKARIYPVDFGATFSKLYNFQITLPAGYTVEELPKNATFTLDNHGGQFKYEASQLYQKIVINMFLVINKTLFLPEEYAALKRFYDNVINKQTEQLVLKKKTT